MVHALLLHRWLISSGFRLFITIIVSINILNANCWAGMMCLSFIKCEKPDTILGCDEAINVFY